MSIFKIDIVAAILFMAGLALAQALSNEAAGPSLYHVTPTYSEVPCE